MTEPSNTETVNRHSWHCQYVKWTLGRQEKIPLAQDANNMTLADSLHALDAMQEGAQQHIQQQINQHAMTQSQLNQLRNTNSSKGSKIAADIRNNAILIRDDIDKRQMYQDLINKLDQLEMSLKLMRLFVDIDRSKLQELGVNWRIGSGSTEASFNASGADPFLFRRVCRHHINSGF
ncbi:secretin N-terminal domain-containing protein [Vibrio sp. PP-XX7]